MADLDSDSTDVQATRYCSSLARRPRHQVRSGGQMIGGGIDEGLSVHRATQGNPATG
jgi:hypothetical protein